MQSSSSVRDRQLGATLYALEKSGARIGSTRYLSNGTYGLSTLNHSQIKLGADVCLQFVGKKKKVNFFVLRSPLLKKWLEYSKHSGLSPFAPATVVRVFLKTEFGTTPKDYRTWRSNLHVCTKKGNQTERISHAASKLHHTRNISRKFYIHPEISLIDGGGKNAELKMRRIIKKW